MNTCPWCGTPAEIPYLKVKDYFLTQEEFTIYKCEHCHLLFTTPRPDPAIIGRYYQSENYYSHQENKRGFIPRIYEWVKSINMRHKRRLASESLVPGNVLDIGCGVGDFLLTMKNQGWNVTGIEPSEDARVIAEKRLGCQLLTPADSTILPDHGFDLITMWHVLEHVDDLRTQLTELERLLKPGGRLLLALPNFKSYDALRYGEYWAAWDVPRHLNHFSPSSIHSLFDQTTLQLVDIQKLKWDAYYISFLSESYLHHRLPLVRGFFAGFKSNCKAIKTGMSSSLVYRFKKS